MTGAACAQKLAENGASVTIFEAGRGVGGRMSTRKTEEGFQFDHGAQYISSSKTEEFRTTLSAWEKSGWIESWEGDFCTVDVDGILKSDDAKKERWVGCPSMNTICENLLDHKSIQLYLQCRAKAVWKDDKSQWELFSTGENEIFLGCFDWLIATDRISAAPFRDDFSNASLDQHRHDVSKIQSVRALAAMVVFDRPITTLSMNGILFDNKPYDKSSPLSLGWAARDSSKPGRKGENDDRECWVLQTYPEAAEAILNEINDDDDDDLDAIRERAREVLVSDFIKFLKERSSSDSMEVPKVVASFGHRWGAAFPIAGEHYSNREVQTYPSRSFISCGDYFGKLSGRIEGAYLSGIAAATELLHSESVEVPR
ncbi:unnamed protein product [Cylindrotheca closterium]|uniref:Amine oxidase n=1 Tax=Cylindrotheca closterium TaxID=2856 RepID=A0AAD2FTS4_9STRA|nr:unnamed protein product [Cylindrotheca closterium]